MGQIGFFLSVGTGTWKGEISWLGHRVNSKRHDDFVLENFVDTQIPFWFNASNIIRKMIVQSFNLTLSSSYVP